MRLLARAVGAAAIAVVGFTGPVAQEAGDWPHFLGPARDGSVPGPPIVPWEGRLEAAWRVPVGEGYAGPVVRGDTVVVFHRQGDEEVVEGLSTADGSRRWRVAYGTTYRDDFGFGTGPRAAPTIDGDIAYTFGAQGILQAVSVADGEVLWRVDTHERFDVPKGFFGAAGSPLLVGGTVLLNVGGPGAGVVGLDATTGDTRWQALDDAASYSSPVLARVGGRDRAIFFTRTGLVDVDPETGDVAAQLRWRSRSRASVNAASPLIVDGRVFLSACYGTGAVLLGVEGDDYRPVWSSDRALSTHYATAVHHDGTLFGFDGALHLGPPSLRAVDLLTGELRWSVDRYGGGAILRTGDRLLIQRDNGELVLASATASEYAPLASARILDGETRAYPAMAGGVWYARDDRELVAVPLPR